MKRHVAPDGPREVDELRGRLRDVMIRNRRSECGVQLPPRRAVTLAVEPTPAERALYAAVSDVVREVHAARAGDAAVEARAPWLKAPGARPSPILLRLLQQEAGSSARAIATTLDAWQEHPRLGPLHELAWRAPASAKLAVLERVVREAGEPVLVFTLFRATQDEVVLALRERGHSVNAYHGGLTRTEKDAAVEAFRARGGVLVATESGSEGRNLQFCRHLVNYDLPWNPMRIEQRVGRLHRIGQTRPVSIVNLAMRGTLEEELLRVLESKIALFELVVGELDMILGELESEGSFEERVFDAWARAADDAGARGEFDALGEELRRGKDAYVERRAFADVLLGDALSETGGGGAGP